MLEESAPVLATMTMDILCTEEETSGAGGIGSGDPELGGCCGRTIMPSAARGRIVRIVITFASGRRGTTFCLGRDVIWRRGTTFARGDIRFRMRELGRGWSIAMSGGIRFLYVTGIGMAARTRRRINMIGFMGVGVGDFGTRTLSPLVSDQTHVA